MITPVPLRFAQHFKHQLDFVEKYVGPSTAPSQLDTKRVPISTGALLYAHERWETVRKAIGVTSNEQKDKNLVVACAALASWRRTQFIYQFDPDLSHALAQTPKNVVLHSDVMKNLPAPCVWIESTVQMGRGCFAMLDETVEPEGRKYVVWFVTLNGAETASNVITGNESIQAIVVPLDLPLDEAIATAYAKLGQDVHAELADVFATLAACAIYLCSEEPDVQGAMSRTNRGRVARRERPFSPTVFQAGARFGAAFRKALADHTGGEATGTGRSPIPHFRRAHWHSYWLGPRDKPDERRKTVKWLSPIAVNVKDEQAVSAVVRKVKT